MGKLYKTLIFDGEISLSVLETTDIVNKAIEYHNLTPVCAAALGRVLTVTAFMSSSLKSEGEKLSITIEGDGIGGSIVTAADGRMTVRGLNSNPLADLPLNSKGKLDVGGVVGKCCDGSSVKNCVNNSTVIAKQHVGGIAGRHVGNGTTMDGCTNNGNVYCTSTATTYGQIYGQNGATVTNCTENGTAEKQS